MSVPSLLSTTLTEHTHNHNKANTEWTETVRFGYQDQSYKTTIDTGIDPSMKAGESIGLTLSNFLARPVKIADINWGTTGIPTISLNPWSQFLGHSTVRRKIANYKLLRGDLNVKVVINGSPYYVGLAMMNYHPLPGGDDYLPRNTPNNICSLSQRMKVMLNPTTSTGGEIVLPFVYRYNYVSIPLSEWDQLGNLTFTTIAPLEGINGGNPIVNISVYAYMDNVKLEQPTSELPVFEGNSSEGSKKILSKTATAAANIAGSLEPVIGPGAVATRNVFRAAGALADALGYSKPREMEDPRYVTRRAGSTATINGKDTSRTLALDIQQELTLDPRTMGLGGKDEMAFENLVTRETIMDSFTWSRGMEVDHDIYTIPVKPFIKSGFLPGTSQTVELSPAGYLSTFFTVWRGSLNFRFQMVASGFHRGKIRIRYEPAQTVGSDYNVVKSEVYELGGDNDFHVKVGWGAHKNWLMTTGGRAPEPPNVSGPIDLGCANGSLIVSVVSPLVPPSTEGSSSITCVVSMSADKDFQLAVPSTYGCDRFSARRRFQPIAPAPPPPTVNPVEGGANMDVAVYYYGWHSNNFHNGGDYLRRNLDGGGQFPKIGATTIGEYDDTSRTVVRKQFDLMLQAGINTVVYSWWGSNSMEEAQFHSALKLETGADLQACAFLEMLPYRRLTGGSFVTNENMLSTLTSEVTHLAQQHFTYPNYKRKARKGESVLRPVLYVYLLRAYSAADQLKIVDAIRAGADAAGSVAPYIVGDIMFGDPKPLSGELLDKLGALSVYDVYGQRGISGTQATAADVKRLHDRYIEWNRLNDKVHVIPTIGPGYNDIVTRDGNTPLSRRLVGGAEGSLFNEHLKNLERSAIDDMVVINSWNEWHEDSQIEPVSGPTSSTPSNITAGLEYPGYDYLYLNLLRSFTQGASAEPITDALVGNSAILEGNCFEGCLRRAAKAVVRDIFENSSDDHHLHATRTVTDVDYEWHGNSTEVPPIEDDNDHIPESTPDTELAKPQETYGKDDTTFFGERVVSIRAMLKRYSFVQTSFIPGSVQLLTRFALPDQEKATQDLLKRKPMLTMMSLLFLGWRGSIRWKLFIDSRNVIPTNVFVCNAPAVAGEAQETIVPTDVVRQPWLGFETANSNDGVVEFELPFYSDKRFEYARKINDYKRGYTVGLSGKSVEYVHECCATGEDFSFFFFVGVPTLLYGE